MKHIKKGKKMWSTEIEDILQTSDNFLGCFPLDELPPFPQILPASIIVNTDISTEIGNHWLALVLDESECFYFDSFGLPILEETLIKYLEPYYSLVTYSDLCIQHIESDKCGECCILFVKHVNSKPIYENFLSQFNKNNLLQNDVIVEQWLNAI